MGVYLEGAHFETLSTAAGQVLTRTYRVSLSDGQLTVRLQDLGGSDVNAVLNGLEIVWVSGSGGVTAAAVSSPMSSPSDGRSAATILTAFPPDWTSQHGPAIGSGSQYGNSADLASTRGEVRNLAFGRLPREQTADDVTAVAVSPEACDGLFGQWWRDSSPWELAGELT
jgi:hypothetical protein